jgi:protein-tyrosine phosphatase
MVRVLFVCHGNICRSPMAEFVMKDLVKKAGLEKDFYIESAATSDEELGNPVYPPARRKLKEHGLDCDGKSARHITASDYDRFDYIVAMDKMNLRNISYIIKSDPEHKISLLMDYTSTKRDVADPWFTGDFDVTWDDVSRGCSGLLKKICSNGI